MGPILDSLRSHLRRSLGVAATAVLCTLPGEAGSGPRVVLISIDGFAAYHLADESLTLPNLRALAERGTRADSSQTVFPSVTHPSHTTIVTGVMPRVHGVIGNRLRNRDTGERFHITNLPHARSVRVPTLFDAAKAAGLGTASFFWPESRDDPALDRSIPEVFDENGRADPAAADPAYLSELRAAGVPIDLFYDLYGGMPLAGVRDVVLALAAAHEIRTRQPELLAIHFVSTDSVQHEYGPAHPLSRAALTNADQCVGILRHAVEEAGLAEQTTFVIAADHGFHTVRYELNLHPLFAETGLARKLSFHPGHWALSLETTPEFDPARDGPALDAALERALALEHVARVVRPEDLHGLGLPRYEEDPHVRGQYIVVGDVETALVADPEDQWSGRRQSAEPYHGHGYLPDHPRMYPALLLSGRGVRPGQRIGHVHNLDIAPTIAQLLDLEMEGLAGRVLTEALLGRRQKVLSR